MRDVKVSTVSFKQGKFSYSLSGSEKDKVEKVVLQNDNETLKMNSEIVVSESEGVCDIKKMTDTKLSFNLFLSMVAVFKDGKTQVLDADETVYETLLSTWFDPIYNLHYFAKKGEMGQLLIGIWKTGSSRIKKGGYFLEGVEVSGDSLDFSGVKKANPVAKDAELLLWSKKRKETIAVPLNADEFNRAAFTLDIHDIKEEIAVGGVRWDIMVRFRDEENNLAFYRFEEKRNRRRLRRGNPFQFRFPKKENYKKEQSERFLETIPVETKLNGEPMLVSPNYTIDWQLSLQGILQARYYMRCFTERLVDISLTNEKMKVTVRCKKRGMKIKGLAIVLREDISVRHHFTQTAKVEEKDSILLSYECLLKDIPWQPINYNFVVEEEKDGVIYDIRPKNVSYGFRKRFYSVKWQNSVVMGDNILILMSMRNGNVIIRFRERLAYDDIMYRKREKKARLLYLLGKPVLDHMGIILLFERYSTAAQDNGVRMFEYYMEQGRKHVYYVIRTDVPDYKKVEKYGKHVLPFMSLKHMVYIQAAKVLVSTDTKRHGYQWLGPNSRVYNKLLKKPVVFLQHGVLAMKKVSDIYDRYRTNAMDLFITSSELEKRFVNQSFRYEQARIAVTGLARWDVLVDKSGEMEEKEILFIPTWRIWMDNVTKEEFLKSDYYKEYVHLLKSERLDELLTKHHMKMVFCMHHKFREFVGEFPKVSDRIQLFDFGDTPVNELIMRCSFLVTDYSSVAWDAYYLGKPCVFFQFDYPKYMELQGSYFDMEQELFGVRVTEETALLDEMERCMDSGFEEKEEYRKLKEEYLPYRERDHRARIDRAIQAMKFRGKTEVM